MSELRDLFDELETLLRTARGALAGAKEPKQTDSPEAGVTYLATGEASDDIDQALARIDRARVMGVIPK